MNTQNPAHAALISPSIGLTSAAGAVLETFD
jgi:hypothetical protein